MLAEAQATLDACSSRGSHGHLPYDRIFREHPAHVDKGVCFKGKIIQVIERSGDRYDFRINVTEGEYGFWDDTIYASWEGQRFLDDDIVELVGVVEGLNTYSAIFGQEITIPEIRIMVMRQVDG